MRMLCELFPAAMQVARLVAHANAQGWSVARTITENRFGTERPPTRLMKLLTNAKVQTIVVEHRGRLMRFGYEYVQSVLAAQGRRLVLTSFCARLYERRSARNKVRKPLAAMERAN